VTAVGSGASSMAVQTDGKIVVGGGATLVRYNANGTLDTTFGNGGEVTNLPTSVSSNCLLIQPDGRIVIAGTGTDSATGSTYFVTARFNTNGPLDSTFGTGGVVTTQVGTDVNCGGVTIDGSGRILVAGIATSLDSDGVDRQGEYLVRYNANGTLDAGF